MDYIFRPKETEHYCLYQYFSKVKNCERKKTEKEDIECYYYAENHPMHEQYVVCYRQLQCVPVFCWNWLGWTGKFNSSLLDTINPTSADFRDKEEYAYRFMILFMPFRDFSDFQIEGSFLRKWQQMHEENRFSSKMIAIADNIQTIRNSLESSIPTNLLASETELFSDDTDNGYDNEEDNSELQEDFLTLIGELFATTAGGTALTEESSKLDPIFSGKVFKSAQFLPEISDLASALEMQSVMQFAIDQEHASVPENGLAEYIQRFVTGTRELNSLSLHQLLRVNDNPTVSNMVVNATGTWESIVMWGINAGLDEGQQCAFEILVANYVLTFSEDAKKNDDENEIAFRDRLEKLCKLGRRDPQSFVPLCMFVTGPAGAGKCMYV
jgi:hypothetical protein